MEVFKVELLARTDEIVNAWTREVCRYLKPSHKIVMTYKSIRSWLPAIIETVAACLENVTVEEPSSVSSSDFWECIHIRVKGGFDIEEMLREFGVLRMLLVSILELDFSKNDVSSTAIILSQIDAVLKLIMVSTAERYNQYRTKRLESFHRKLLSTNQELVRLVQPHGNASHLAYQLKPSLNKVLSFSSLLIREQKQRSPTTAATAKELKQLERIYENGKQMLQLVDNMLENSILESQQLETRAVEAQKFLARTK